MALLLLLVAITGAMVMGTRAAYRSAREEAIATAQAYRNTVKRLGATVRELDRGSSFGSSIDDALALHEQANEYFRREDYSQAIDAYGEFERAARQLLARDEWRTASREVMEELDVVRTRAKSVSSDKYPDTASKVIEGGIHWDVGVLAFDQGRFDVALECWEQARSLFDEAARLVEVRDDWEEPVIKSNTLSFTNSLGMEMKLIPAGVFLMGSKLSPATVVSRYGGKEEQVEDEHPRHEVEISEPFYLGVHEVTVGEFRQFVEATGHVTDAEGTGSALGYKDGKWQEVEGVSWRNPGYSQDDEHPVVCVSWDDGAAFCEWLSRKEGRPYRLPTEAEWEYAARGGATTVYWWGDEMDTTGKVANVGDTKHWNFSDEYKSMPMDDGYKYSSPVGGYVANGYGLHDMIGNAWEWCSDSYGRYTSGFQSSPRGREGDRGRVLRGGSWGTAANLCRCAIRGRRARGNRGDDSGIRVALGT